MRLLRQRSLTRGRPLPLGSGPGPGTRARLVATFLLGAGACTSGNPVSEEAAVAASIFPLYDIARRVAGSQAAVALVLPAGRMDHTFEPRPQDLVRLARVELAFGLGLGLDPWLHRILDAATDGRARVVDLAPALDPRAVPAPVLALGEGESDSLPGPPEGPRDPHVHLDPRRMARAATLIAEALAARDALGKAGYRARATLVREQMEGLDRELRARSRDFTRRTIVTFHGSFFYFAEAYGITIAAVVEPLPGREPKPRHIARVVEAIRTSGAAAIFTEPQLDPAPARLIAEETGLPLLELDPVGGGPGALSYEELLRKNMSALEKALR